MIFATVPCMSKYLANDSLCIIEASVSLFRFGVPCIGAQTALKRREAGSLEVAPTPPAGWLELRLKFRESFLIGVSASLVRFR